MPSQNIYRPVRIRSHHAKQLLEWYESTNPADLPQALTAFLGIHLAPPSHVKTRRFGGETYELLAFGLQTCPGPSGCKKRWGQTHSKFRKVSKRDGWVVYGLPKQIDPPP